MSYGHHNSKMPPARQTEAKCRSPADVTKRLDRLIDDIRTRFHNHAIGKPKDEAPISDVLLVAHGHILRAFAMRWIGRDLTTGVSLLLEGMYFFAFFLIPS